MVSDLVSEIMTILGDECIGSRYLLEPLESLVYGSRIAYIKNRENLLTQK